MTTWPHRLQAQQRAFGAIVRAGADSAGLLRERPVGPSLIAIYQHAYPARLTSALRDNHEVLARALGDEAFDRLARAFIDAHPSRQPSIRWFGAGLADFMTQHEELVPHPAMADIARMDWAVRGAFDAADATPITRDALLALPADAWPELRFDAHPSVRIVPLHWRIERAWRDLRRSIDDELPEPVLDAPESGAHHLLVWRLALQPQWRSMEADEAALLGSALRGMPFAGLCEMATTQGHDEQSAAVVVVTALQQWLAEGLIGAVRQGNEPTADGSAGDGDSP